MLYEVITCVWAGDETPTVLSNKEAISLVQAHADYVWTLVAAALVFFMQAGFAMVEAGFTRAKNAINIMMKNLMDFSMGSLAFWAVGFGLMFGVSKTGWFGTSVITSYSIHYTKLYEVLNLESFERILAKPSSSFNVLNEMLNTAFLIRFIPEFIGISNRIQYDEYHLYP